MTHAGIVRRAAAAAVAAVAALAALPAAAATFRVTLLEPADDARLERSRLERAALGHPGGPAVEALRVALAEAQIELDTVAAKIDLDVAEVADAAAARAAAQKAAKGGALAIVTDLPAAWATAVADAVPRLPVLNTGAADDALREAGCRRNVWHLIPSERMRADALAQTLVARKWTNVLLLVGPGEAVRAAAAQSAMRRYGLKVVASKAFKLSADPRERDLANPWLLTNPASTGAYDVVWVVDSDGEFAQLLPYRTASPRPVVGDGGLAALAWSHRFERFGAPQVSRRLVKAARRLMTAPDWAAWMAGKALVAAAVAVPKKPEAFAQALAAVELDGSKGVLLSFRPWDGQLRQPLLLTDGQAVIGTAPVEGVLHPKNVLDTLGADAPERLCKARAAE